MFFLLSLPFSVPKKENWLLNEYFDLREPLVGFLACFHLHYLSFLVDI